MRKLTSEEIKQRELSILQAFDRVCRQNNLKYCLAYGTCLGAIRHRGFIPWDDDIDVYMPRHDYEKLHELHRTQSIDWPYTIKSSRDRSSYHPSIKIVDPRTRCHEAFVAPQFNIGLWIDVFPLDEVDLSAEGSKAKLSKVLKRTKSLRKKLEFAVGDPHQGTSPIATAVKTIASPISRTLDPYSISQQIEEAALSLSSNVSDGAEGSTLVDVTESVGSCSWIFPRDLICPTSTAVFEGRSYPVPREPERYLKICYGDWRRIPPENERHLHITEAYLVE